MSRGNVNTHFDHPLRLAAVASDAPHYNTGEPCFRGHLANRYAKNGRCVQCCSEDRKTWTKVQPAEYFRRRAHTPGVRRKQKRRHDKMVAMYDMLVANGLPVNPERTLAQRRQDAWRAFRELTSEDPIYTPPWQPNPNSLTERCRISGLSEIDVGGVRRYIHKGKTFDKAVVAYLASKVRRARAQQQSEQNAADRRARESARQQRDKKLGEIAKATGAKPNTLRAMSYRGKSLDEITTKAERTQLGRQRRVTAKANGIGWNTVNARVYSFGWDWQRAITEKPSANLPQPNSKAGQARARKAALTMRIDTRLTAHAQPR